MSQKRALVVGVGYYAIWPELPGCINDAVQMEDVLQLNKDGTDNFAVVTITGTADSPLTRRDLMDEFDLLLEGSDDCDLVFYFTGHGSVTKFGLQLAVSDAESRNAAGVSFEDLMHRALQENFRSLTCILDCCFAGSASDIGLDTQLNISLMRPNVTVLASSQRLEPSVATPTISAYTEAILNGFKGAAIDASSRVTPFELHRYSADEMVKLGNSHPVLKSLSATTTCLRQC